MTSRVCRYLDTTGDGGGGGGPASIEGEISAGRTLGRYKSESVDSRLESDWNLNQKVELGEKSLCDRQHRHVCVLPVPIEVLHGRIAVL